MTLFKVFAILIHLQISDIFQYQFLLTKYDSSTMTFAFTGILITSKENEIFENKIGEGVALLEQQTKVYEAEERALRVLREEEVEDFERNENEKRKKRKQKGNE